MIKTNIFICFFTLLVLTNFYFANSKILYVWSQAVPENKLSVRAIVDNNICPIFYIENKKIEMLNRISINNINYIDETICEITLEKNVKKINIDNIQIPVLPKNINKIAFIGDTGCRINALFQQECNSLNSWPLKKNLDSIASHNPDLIVHVGDYHYRESRCRNKQKCNDIYGYNKKAWYADWFEPAKNIFLQSTFLFVRGNHENCDKAHEGWFRYLDPYPFSSKKCENFTPSWFLDIGPMKFYILDSSSNKVIFTNKNAIINTFEKQFKNLIKDKSNKPIWLLTHRPIWENTNELFLLLKNYTKTKQIEFFENKIPKNITTIVSGHIHIAQILFVNELPDQVIIGNGGALLHSQNQKSIYQNVKLNYSNYIINKIRNFFGFGFAILNLNDKKFTFYNQNNNEVYSIKLTKKFKFEIK